MPASVSRFLAQQETIAKELGGDQGSELRRLEELLAAGASRASARRLIDSMGLARYLESRPDSPTAFTRADELRRRIFDAFRLSIAID